MQDFITQTEIMLLTIFPYRESQLKIRNLQFLFWLGQPNTNIENFCPKNPSQHQYERKNFHFFYPIPIQESFLDQKSTRDQYNIKKFLGGPIPGLAKEHLFLKPAQRVFLGFIVFFLGFIVFFWVLLGFIVF